MTSLSWSWRYRSSRARSFSTLAAVFGSPLLAGGQLLGVALRLDQLDRPLDDQVVNRRAAHADPAAATLAGLAATCTPRRPCRGRVAVWPPSVPCTGRSGSAHRSTGTCRGERRLGRSGSLSSALARRHVAWSTSPGQTALPNVAAAVDAPADVARVQRHRRMAWIVHGLSLVVPMPRALRLSATPVSVWPWAIRSTISTTTRASTGSGVTRSLR